MTYLFWKIHQFAMRYKILSACFAAIMFLVISYGAFLMIGVMGFMLFFVFSVALAFIYTKKIREFIFLSMIVLVENFFYLFDRLKLIFIYDLKQLVGFLLLVLFIIYFPKILQNRFHLFRSILLFMGYQIFSVFTAYFTLGQPLIKGAYTLLMPSMILIYFFVCFLIADLDRYERIKTLLIYSSMVAGSIYILQTFVYPGIVFLTTDFRFRYGNLRFTEFAVFMLFCAFITLNELLFKVYKEPGYQRHLYMLALLIQLYTFFFIAQSRFLTITTWILLGAALLIFQKRIPRHLMAVLGLWSGLGLSALLIVLYLQGKLPRLDFILDTLEEVVTISGNFGIRSKAVSFFVENLKEHWIFGWGTLNLDFPKAYFVSGVIFWHYMVDVGILGYTYQYGLLGSLVAVQLMVHALLVSWKIYKKDQRIFFPLLCCFAVLMNSMMVFFYQESMALFYVGLIFAFMEFEYRKAFKDEGGTAANEDSYGFTMSNASSEPR